MNSTYMLKKEGNDFIVDEFLRGNTKTISLDDYVSQGNDVGDLFKDYLVQNPTYGDNLRFEDSKPGFCKITDGNIVLDEIAMSDVRIKVKGNEKFMDVVDYAQIFMNTREYDSQSKKVSTDSGIMDNVNDAIGELKRGGVRSALNKYKGIALVGLGVALGGSLIYGISNMGEEKPHYEMKAEDFKNYFLDAEQKLSKLTDFYNKSPAFAEVQVNDVIERLGKISEKDMSEENRKKLEDLVKEAEKYKDLITKKIGVKE